MSFVYIPLAATHSALGRADSNVFLIFAVLLPMEYMFEHGQLSTGGPRNHENMFATEAAFKF